MARTRIDENQHFTGCNNKMIQFLCDYVVCTYFIESNFLEILNSESHFFDFDSPPHYVCVIRWSILNISDEQLGIYLVHLLSINLKNGLDI